MWDQILYWTAQAMGILITVFCVVQPLFKKKWQMLIVTASTNLLGAFNNLILAGLGSAVILCLVAVAQTIFNYVHTRKEEEVPLWEKIVFTILYLGCGIFGFLNATSFAPFADILLSLREILPVTGALFLMISVFASNAQNMRKFSLVSAVIWLIYYAIILSTTVFAEIFAVATTCFALYKYRQVPKAENSAENAD